MLRVLVCCALEYNVYSYFLFCIVLPLAFFSWSAFVLPMVDEVCTPIKLIREPARTWVSAGWLSKQMTTSFFGT